MTPPLMREASGLWGFGLLTFSNPSIYHFALWWWWCLLLLLLILVLLFCCRCCCYFAFLLLFSKYCARLLHLSTFLYRFNVSVIYLSLFCLLFFCFLLLPPILLKSLLKLCLLWVLLLVNEPSWNQRYTLLLPTEILDCVTHFFISCCNINWILLVIIALFLLPEADAPC